MAKKGSWDDVEETMEVDEKVGTVSVESAEAAPESAEEKPARKPANFNGLTSGQYAALRKAGQTPAKYVGGVSINVASQMVAAGEAVTDEALDAKIAEALAADDSDAGKASATWWSNVSMAAKRRIFNTGRKSTAPAPVAE